MTLWELVVGAAEDHPDRVLLADGQGRTVTAAELRDAAERVASGLAVGAGRVVSWQLPTAIEAVVLLVALARIGAVQNPIIPILRDREVRSIAGQAGTALLVVPERWRGFAHGDMARAIARDHGFDVLALDLEGNGGWSLRLPQADPTSLPPPPATDDECRWLYFTSGTTAAPKAVRHTEGDVYPIAWPITHIGGITMISAVLRAGGHHRPAEGRHHPQMGRTSRRWRSRTSCCGTPASSTWPSSGCPTPGLVSGSAPSSCRPPPGV